MRIVRTLAELHAARAGLPGSLALVPTMGALHDGHLSLVRAARARGGPVAATIFVNPTQFGPNEDFSRYPRDPDADCAMLDAEGCDLVWLPEVDTLYPPDSATMIDVAGPALLWEGAARPGHFRGVATVVARLFGHVRPDSAFFGEKDWQQVQVIRRMAADLLLPVEIVAAPIRREADGLAMSSRNRYLGPEDRARAPTLFATLCATRDRLREGDGDGDGDGVAEALAAGRETLAGSGFIVDYYALVAPESLAPLDALARPARLIAAARLGATRLLDNIAV
ncbi:MAG TPA: pantoate--beta-alanine ligase [Acidiphilium sp.]